MLAKSTELATRAKPQYILPELVFTADGPEEMEYIHGVTHATSSVLVTDPQDASMSSLMGAALVNIQGISHGLEVNTCLFPPALFGLFFLFSQHPSNALPLNFVTQVQKYNLRQSTVVERFSDVDYPSLALALPETSLMPIYQERYASLWMDVSEFESRPRRSTLSNCDFPSTVQTGVLYMRCKCFNSCCYSVVHCPC